MEGELVTKRGCNEGAFATSFASCVRNERELKGVGHLMGVVEKGLFIGGFHAFGKILALGGLKSSWVWNLLKGLELIEGGSPGLPMHCFHASSKNSLFALIEASPRCGVPLTRTHPFQLPGYSPLSSIHFFKLFPCFY